MGPARNRPRVRVYISDLAAQERFFTALSKDTRFPRPYIDAARRFRQINASVDADEKALGLTPCIGPLPQKPSNATRDR
jgi:hypothetical protein